MTLTVSGRWGDLIKDLIGDGPAPNNRCEHCDREFYSTRPDHRFCKRSCKQMAWAKLQPKKPLAPLNCLTCGASMPRERVVGARPKTCSAVCKAIHEQSYPSRITRKPRPKPTRYCRVCKAVLTTSKRTCSEVCAIIHKAKK